VCAGASCTVALPDLAPPDPPTGLVARDVGGVELRWTTPHDDVGVTGYEVHRDGVPIATTGATPSYTDLGAPPTGDISYEVVALDRAGNRSSSSAPLVVSRNRTALFDDGFESGTTAAWSTVLRTTVQQQDVAVGAWAARLLAPAAPAYARAGLSSPAPAVTLHLRFLLRSKGSGNPVILARAFPSAGLGVKVFVAKDGKLSFVNETTGANVKSPTAVTLGTWHELELVVRNGSGGHVTVRMDGLVPAKLDRAQSLGSAPFASLQIGDHLAHRTYDLIVDDVQVATLT
jgi:hypothetical protein